ncbi:MAG: alpha/beta fold hydrolase [Myxococcaceae bacterium]
MSRAAPRGLALLALALAAGGCSGVYSEPLPAEAVLHRAKTEDGWELSLVQYRAVGPSRGRPVLLCHGISANARNMDLDKDHSMARWFAAHGREAWTLSLRGTGESDGVDSDKGRPGGYDFDTLWRQDTAAAVRYVRAQTGAAQLDYVGHSMGGMLVYAYLSQGGEGLGAVATLGSPTRLDWGGLLDPLLQGVGGLALSQKWAVPSGLASQLTAGAQTALDDGPIQRLLYNPRNVTPQTWRRLAAIGTANISGAVALQFISQVKTGAFGSADGKLDYRKDLGKVRTPVLVVAGKLDHIAITPAVKDGYRALGGEKEWLLLSEESGAQADYGHMDLVVGERAATEVWPRVLDFFDRHASSDSLRGP